MSQLPIGDYALLSDCRSACLVSRDGSIDWLCFPRFDSPSVFARLLDADAGHWALRPAGEMRSERAYAEGSMVLETTFDSASGRVKVTDAMAIGRNVRGHDLGVGSPGVVLRSVTCEQGTVEMELEYMPRLEYGLIHPLLIPVDGGVTS